MSRGIFEDIGSLSIVGIYGINFTYDTNMAVYTMLSLDIPNLSEMLKPALKNIKR
jgi:hypothetical protein